MGQRVEAAQAQQRLGPHLQAQALLQPGLGLRLALHVPGVKARLHQGVGARVPHGDPVDAPGARLAELIAHRQLREGQILAALRQAPASADELARAIYTDTPPALLGAASRNVLAHLVDLHQQNRITTTTHPALDAIFTIA